ncbi:hypothetical protein Dimus_010025, partial [Dionaea muscipula]
KRTQKFLKAKSGGAEDEMHDDIEDEDDKNIKLRTGSRAYYGADNVGTELHSSDEDSLAEEEEEAKRLQRERAKSLSLVDFGIKDAGEDDSDTEPTLEELLAEGKDASRPSTEAENEVDVNYGELKRDLSGLSRDELMEVLYIYAPELVGLLGELNDALKQLEDEVDPLLDKCSIKIWKEHAKKEEMHYLEIKRLLLLTYCQAITFYLLLKSEGLPVKDHPVVERLVDIKSLLDKIEELDANLPSGLVEMLNENNDIVTATASAEHNTAALLNSVPVGNNSMRSLAEKHGLYESEEAAGPVILESPKDGQKKLTKNTRHIKEAAAPVDMDISKDRRLKLVETTHHQNEHVSKESVKMLKLREALEQNLKQKGIITSCQLQGSGTKRHKPRLLNGRLETHDDFDDDAMDVEGARREVSNGQPVRLSKKLTHLIATKNNKPKVISGDDDLPKRDDLGERRRKHELRVLSGAGIKPDEDEEDADDRGDDDAHGSLGDDTNTQAEGDSNVSEDDMYEQVKERRAQKLAMKAMKYSRHPSVPLVPETTVDGKRQITTQMEKNRGLTRSRRKDKKNPRKNYKTKYKKAQQRHGGQVRKQKRPTGPYGGEASGINISTTHSIRFKD